MWFVVVIKTLALGIYNWYIILDSILASNTVGGLLVNCKYNLSQVFFEVVDLSTSFFIRPFEKRTYYAMAMSVRLSVRPSVRPSFPDFFSTCFEISIWNLVYASSRWHDMSSLSFITIGSLWPSLQPKVGQTQFLQPWPYISRLILQIWYVDGPLYTTRHKFRFLQKSYFRNFGNYFCAFWILRRFPGFFSTCFEISFWNMVYTFSG